MRCLPVLAIAFAVVAPVAHAQTPVSEPPVVVTVGEGIVKRAPDRAWVTIATESRAKTPAEAQKMNATAMASVMEKLKGAGLAVDAIRTAAYELRPEFDYANNRQTLRGYVVRNSVEARVDDLARLGPVLDLAVSAGANAVNNIRFDLKDRAAAESMALQAAIKDARGQAEIAANAAGSKVERISRIEVQRQGGMPPPRPMMAMRAEVAQADTPIAPGEIEVKSVVTLTAVIR